MPDKEERRSGAHGEQTSEVVPTPIGVKRSGNGPTRGPLAFIDGVQDALTVRRVYGEPIERDGVTIIPAANVRGGGGGGSGKGPEGQGRGWGGGFGVSASPAGAFVIKDATATWRPAIDVNRTILLGQLVTIVLLLTLRSIVRALARRRAGE